MKNPEIVSDPTTTTRACNLEGLIEDIENGNILIPRFQREFVWTLEQARKLMDSILKGFPIGSFIFWHTSERLGHVRNISNLTLPDTNNDLVQYVIDGQQRLISLYSSIKGVPFTQVIDKVKKKKRITRDSLQMYVDLMASKDDSVVVLGKEITRNAQLDGVPSIASEDKTKIKLADLYTADDQIIDSYHEPYNEPLQKYLEKIQEYEFSIIDVKDTPIDVATEIFTRINTQGTELKLFDIMAAKTFDHQNNFDLREKWYDVKDNSLNPLNYHTISDDLVLQIIAAILEKGISRKTITNLDRRKFIDIWPSAINSLKHAIEFIRVNYRIRDSKLLPYPALLIPFTYFFYKNENRSPSDTQKKFLLDYFWRCSITERYSSAFAGDMDSDIRKRIDIIIQEGKPNYDPPDWKDINNFLSADYIKSHGKLNLGHSFIKAILSIYLFHRPLTLREATEIGLYQPILKGNKRNYHHFFPIKYLDGQGVSKERSNHVLNIVFSTAAENKKIGTDSPSLYINNFRKVNPNINDVLLNNHLISVSTIDDYDRFIEDRANKVLEELKKRIILN